MNEMIKQRKEFPMKINNRWFVQFGLLIASTCLFSVFAYAKDIQIITEKPYSVSFVKAEVIRSSDGKLVIGGFLNRPYRLPMAGHVHAYVYRTNGHLVSDRKHRVPGLNSQRGGSMRVPFRISIKNVADEIGRVHLEYHSPGHSET